MPVVGLDHDCLAMERLPDVQDFRNIHVWSYHIRSNEGGTPVGYHAILLTRRAGSKRLTMLHTMSWDDVWETEIFLGLTEDFVEDDPTGRFNGLSSYSLLDRYRVPSENPFYRQLQTALLDWLETQVPPL